MKKFYILYIVVIAITAVIYSSVTISNFEKSNSNTNNIDEKNIEYNTKQVNNYEVKNDVEQKEFYTVKYVDGAICVYNPDDKIIKQLDVDYNTLRDYDKKLLLDGFSVNTIEEVYLLSEDFSN